jgi:hypothetical protein
MALPHALFLVLGYGAQGASANEAARGFRRSPAGFEGGIVSSSRPILFPTAFYDSGGHLGASGAQRTWENNLRTRSSSRLGLRRNLTPVLFGWSWRSDSSDVIVDQFTEHQNRAYLHWIYTPRLPSVTSRITHRSPPSVLDWPAQSQEVGFPDAR